MWKISSSHNLLCSLNQLFIFSFALMPLGIGVIIYFLSLISLKKLKISILGNHEKIRLIGSLKKNIRFIFTSKKVFVFMILYVLAIGIMKVLKLESGIDYIDGIIFSLEYLFISKYAMVNMENKMIVESGSVKSARRYRILVVVMLLFNVKLMYIAVVVNYIINDRNGRYREMFASAAKKEFE